MSSLPKLHDDPRPIRAEQLDASPMSNPAAIGGGDFADPATDSVAKSTAFPESLVPEPPDILGTSGFARRRASEGRAPALAFTGPASAGGGGAHHHPYPYHTTISPETANPPHSALAHSESAPHTLKMERSGETGDPGEFIPGAFPDQGHDPSSPEHAGGSRVGVGSHRLHGNKPYAHLHSGSHADAAKSDSYHPYHPLQHSPEHHDHHVMSKWELPTHEEPSGSRCGVGSLPGKPNESGVALLPEERLHNADDILNSHLAPRLDQLPSTEHPSGSTVGVGSLPGKRNEQGVALLPEERLHPADTILNSHLPPRCDQLPSTEHLSGSTVGVGSLPGNRNEKGVALLPDERHPPKRSSHTRRRSSTKGWRATHPVTGPQSPGAQATIFADLSDVGYYVHFSRITPPEPPLDTTSAKGHHHHHPKPLPPNTSKYWQQLPTTETPSISRGGVGSLPGKRSEQGVAMLPEERLHNADEILSSHLPPRQDQLPTTEHPSGCVVGVGSLPGEISEAGVALLPDERQPTPSATTTATGAQSPGAQMTMLSDVSREGYYKVPPHGRRDFSRSHSYPSDSASGITGPRSPGAQQTIFADVNDIDTRSSKPEGEGRERGRSPISIFNAERRAAEARRGGATKETSDRGMGVGNGPPPPSATAARSSDPRETICANLADVGYYQIPAHGGYRESPPLAPTKTTGPQSPGAQRTIFADISREGYYEIPEHRRDAVGGGIGTVSGDVPITGPQSPGAQQTIFADVSQDGYYEVPEHCDRGDIGTIASVPGAPTGPQCPGAQQTIFADLSTEGYYRVPPHGRDTERGLTQQREQQHVHVMPSATARENEKILERAESPTVPNPELQYAQSVKQQREIMAEQDMNEREALGIPTAAEELDWEAERAREKDVAEKVKEGAIEAGRSREELERTMHPAGEEGQETKEAGGGVGESLTEVVKDIEERAAELYHEAGHAIYGYLHGGHHEGEGHPSRTVETESQQRHDKLSSESEPLSTPKPPSQSVPAAKQSIPTKGKDIATRDTPAAATLPPAGLSERSPGMSKKTTPAAGSKVQEGRSAASYSRVGDDEEGKSAALRLRKAEERLKKAKESEEKAGVSFAPLRSGKNLPESGVVQGPAVPADVYLEYLRPPAVHRARSATEEGYSTDESMSDRIRTDENWEPVYFDEFEVDKEESGWGASFPGDGSLRLRKGSGSHSMTGSRGVEFKTSGEGRQLPGYPTQAGVSRLVQDRMADDRLRAAHQAPEGLFESPSKASEGQSFKGGRTSPPSAARRKGVGLSVDDLGTPVPRFFDTPTEIKPTKRIN